MEQKTNLAFIIPAHEMHPGLVPAIDSALANSPKAQVILVATQEVFDALPENRLECLTLLDAPDDTSFPSMVNVGIECAQDLENVQWISILEYDDKVLPYTVKLFNEYQEHFSDTPVFAGLTLICEPQERGGKDEDSPPALSKMANEAAWAPNIMETPGIVDFNAMLRMNFVLLTSTFINLDVIDEVGPMKANMKHFSDYEFLLRIVYNGHEVRAIPIATHYHFEGGRATEALRALPRDEGSFWVNAARKEYFFEFDREIAYEPAEENETTEA